MHTRCADNASSCDHLRVCAYLCFSSFSRPDCSCLCASSCALFLVRVSFATPRHGICVHGMWSHSGSRPLADKPVQCNSLLPNVCAWVCVCWYPRSSVGMPQSVCVCLNPVHERPWIIKRLIGSFALVIVPIRRSTFAGTATVYQCCFFRCRLPRFMLPLRTIGGI